MLFRLILFILRFCTYVQQLLTIPQTHIIPLRKLPTMKAQIFENIDSSTATATNKMDVNLQPNEMPPCR